MKKCLWRTPGGRASQQHERWRPVTQQQEPWKAVQLETHKEELLYFKSKRVTTEESQSQTRDSHVSFSNEKEDLHYGEVNFHKKTPHTSSQHDNERQETVYAEVKVSKPDNNSTVNDSPEEPGVLADCGGASPGISIITPALNEALSGSCLQVPCSFKGENSFKINEVTSGVWIKSPKNIFDTYNGVNKYPIEIIGNLSQKNCTTLFSNVNTSNEGTYFFRIEISGDRATACADPLQVKVKDSPWSPSINIPVGDLKEHQSVNISCSAVTPCPHSPPELTWNLQQDSERQTEKNTDGTFTTKIQKTISLSDTHDGYNISCSARYPVNGGNKTAETEVTLSVSYAPKDTSASISPSGLVSAGSWVELSCSSRAKPPASFTWFRNSKHGAINVSVGQVYSFNVTEGGEYYCEARNDLGTQRSAVIILDIKGNPLFLTLLLAGIIVIVLILLMIMIWCFKSKRSNPKQTQNQTGEEADVEKAADIPEEEIHYGQVNFCKKEPEASTVSLQDCGEQETVYAQVKASNAGNSSTRTHDRPEDLYAQVNVKKLHRNHT
ncbi:PREDICTED: sialic acid-binding Ig-like lectin 13 [Cyprinodon variegatus]|uniref:sialic acid-binding Ig-like lectin 13 n=1 Tax=Cyprinodon variegatus TaxID=28743 RepID=UPI0007429190|nr:PREDICTED: sialic acid-binding Ig-like lectin 13 [Cyprinodon variegatus]